MLVEVVPYLGPGPGVWSAQGEPLDRKTRNSCLELASAIFDFLEIRHNGRSCQGQIDWLSALEFERNRTITVA